MSSHARKNNRTTSWWNQHLAERRKKFRRLFTLAKKSGNWTDYKWTLTGYNKALRQAKRESWRRHCEEIEKASECARLHKILSEDGTSSVSSIQLANGEYATSERGVLEELFMVHFPGSEIIMGHSEDGTALKLSFRNGRDQGKTGRLPKGTSVMKN